MSEAIQLVITMTPDGKVNVSGPIANKVLSYGLLQMAHDAIKDYKPNETSPIVLVPANGYPKQGGN